MAPSTPRLAASQHTSSSFALISEHRRALLLAVGCAVGQAATGGSTVLYYSREVLEMAGYENALWGEVRPKPTSTTPASACTTAIISAATTSSATTSAAARS